MEFHLEPKKVTYLDKTVWVHTPTPRDYLTVAAYVAKDQEMERLPERERMARIGMLLAMQCTRKGPERNSERVFPDLAMAEDTCPLELCKLLAAALTSFSPGVEELKNG